MRRSRMREPWAGVLRTIGVKAYHAKLLLQVLRVPACEAKHEKIRGMNEKENQG
jgi:hypothetical protein